MTDSMGPGKLVRHMQNPSYTYDEYLICIGLGPSISSVICKNLSYSGPSYPSSTVLVLVSSSPSAAKHTEDYICSVVLGQDIVPRLGIVTMENFKVKLLQVIKDSNKPKVSIILAPLHFRAFRVVVLYTVRQFNWCILCAPCGVRI